MRSYTNSKGETINVSQEHLNVAVKIKDELQKLSPSMRCNWKTHKKMMVEEGFDDSDFNEAYRCLIKDYQSKNGLINAREKHVDLVSEKKLSSIKNAVGEMAYNKREIQLESQKLGKLKRELTLWGVVASEISDAVKNINLEKPKENLLKIKSDEERDVREMLVLPSDWHIGYLDEDFNYKKAEERIDLYIKKISEYVKLFDVECIHISHMGDIVENTYMHKTTQSFNNEFSFSEQIIKASELLLYFINSLSLISEKVVYHGIVFGNHGRMYDKKENLHNDCAEYIIHEIVKKVITNSETNVIIDESGYNVERAIFTIKDKIFKITHGDKESQNDKSLVQKHISSENMLIDVLCMGHFHNYKITTENFGRMIYQSGCLQGSTDYGRSLKYNNKPSQGLIIVGNDELVPINIEL